MALVHVRRRLNADQVKLSTSLTVSPHRATCRHDALLPLIDPTAIHLLQQVMKLCLHPRSRHMTVETVGGLMAQLHTCPVTPVNYHLGPDLAPCIASD